MAIFDFGRKQKPEAEEETPPKRTFPKPIPVEKRNAILGDIAINSRVAFVAEEHRVSEDTVRRVMERAETDVRRLVAKGYSASEIVAELAVPEAFVTVILDRMDRAEVAKQAAKPVERTGSLGAQVKELVAAKRGLDELAGSNAPVYVPEYSPERTLTPKEMLARIKEQRMADLLSSGDSRVTDALDAALLHELNPTKTAASAGPLGQLKDLAGTVKQLREVFEVLNPGGGARSPNPDEPLLIQAGKFLAPMLFPNGLDGVATAWFGDRAREHQLRQEAQQLAARQLEFEIARWQQEQRAAGLMPPLPAPPLPVAQRIAPPAFAAEQAAAAQSAEPEMDRETEQHAEPVPVVFPAAAGGPRADLTDPQRKLLLVLTPLDLDRVLQRSDPVAAADLAAALYQELAVGLTEREREQSQEQLEILCGEDDGAAASLFRSLTAYPEWMPALLALQQTSEAWVADFRQHLLTVMFPEEDGADLEFAGDPEERPLLRLRV